MTVATGVERATMAVAVLRRPGEAGLERVPVPVPDAGSGEVRVRVRGCGVCASSLPLWEGRPWFSYPCPPGAPGHEAWGELEDGTPVAFLGERGYAEWAVVPEAHVAALPRGLEGVPFPGEALGCAVNVFRRSEVAPGTRVAIVGMGFLGSALAQLCEAADAEVVPVRRDTPTDGLACELVLETAGTQASLDTASALVGERGRLVIAGFHQDGPRRVDLQSWNWRGLDVVNAHERDPAVYVDGIREAARLAADGVLDLERLVTHRFPLARLGDAFEAARTRPPGFVKAVVEL